MNNLSKTDKAYLAGLIDGEGCIYINRFMQSNSSVPKHSLNLVVAQSDKAYLDHWRAKVGIGKVYKTGNKTDKRRARYQWRMGTAQAGTLLELVRPYLVLKTKQCDIALRFRQTKKHKLSTGGKGKKTPQSILDLRDTYYHQLVDAKK